MNAAFIIPCKCVLRYRFQTDISNLLMITPNKATVGDLSLKPSLYLSGTELPTGKRNQT